MEHLIAQVMVGLQQRLASQIRMGLAYGQAFELLPPAQWSALVAQWNRLSSQQGLAAFTTAEAVLLSRIAAKRPDLTDPDAVNMNDPEVQAIAKELQAVFACGDQRAYAEGLAMGAAAQEQR